ncbi:hypothetical protein KY363_02550 [Candidatus Woesearchaeota archaeon]|nr:hypothetical protein [Candidatus Woesearchaeota archaeon]
MKLSLFKSNKPKDIDHRLTTFSEQLAQAFGQIKNDIESINQRLDSSQSEVERLGQWIGYLNRHAQRVSDSNSKILQKFDKISENHEKLHTSHHALAASHEDVLRKAQTLENGHQRLSEAISGSQDALKTEIREELHGHMKQHREDAEQEIRRLKAWIDYFSTYVDRQKAKEDALKEDIAKVEHGWLESYSKLRELVNGLKSENTELKGAMTSQVRDVKSELEQARNELKNTILELETTKSELTAAKSAIENTAEELQSTRNLAESLKNMPKSEILPVNQPVQAPIQQPEQMVQPVVQPVFQQVPAQSSFQRHILSRVLPNRKGYVLKFIMDLVKENRHSTKEIEEIVVNDKQLCGRTSFYAYLKELKLRGRITYADIDERQILVSTDTQQTLMDKIDRL